MAALPDDILTEVFSYLPAKSVRFFRSLSRSWRATLSSASFLHLHRRRANRPGQLKVFFSPSDKMLHEDGPSSYFYASQPGGAPAAKLTPHRFRWPAPLTRPLHGLVLVRCDITGYHVCNPSTGEAVALPDTALPLKMAKYVPFYVENIAYGLGYCSVTDKYKVVRIFSGPRAPTRCEVVVLGGRPYWRSIGEWWTVGHSPPTCTVDEKNPGVFLDGRLHFLCHGCRIVSFNVSSETFGALEPPPNPWVHVHASARMTELDGCLCVSYVNIRQGLYHIWVLRDYAKPHRRWEQLCRIDLTSWTKSYRMQLCSPWMAPLGMYNGENGQTRIMLAAGASQVFAVNVPDGDALEILFCPVEDEAIAGSFDGHGEPRLGLLEESLTTPFPFE
ncbi:F-box only protein 8-like [Aegilops tauschii subsp. strangulata]|nr:F-box only protein 8-like [Aegilops tauschii subsp. strangulata]